MKILGKIVFIISLCVLGFSLYKLIPIVTDRVQSKHEFKMLENIAFKPVIEQDSNDSIDDEIENLNWDELHAINPDIIAWIAQEDTPINYPVLKGKTNDTYLRRTPEGKYSSAGSIFVESSIEKPFNQFLTIVYGHQVYSANTMFSTLKHYVKDPQYIVEHPTMTIYTEEDIFILNIYGAAIVRGDDPLIYSCNDNYEYLSHLSKINIYDSTVLTKDRIVVLSTCVNNGINRYIVYGYLTKV